jgi:hypothetical protein
MNEEYAEFICISEEMKQKVREMSKEELEMLSSFLSHSLRQSLIKIEEDIPNETEQT